MNDVRISGAVSALGEHGLIGNKGVVFDTMTLDETIAGSGGLTLGWNSITGMPIAPGAYGGFFLLNPYFPVMNEDGSYRYDVKLSELAALLERKYFYIEDSTSEVPMYAFPYSGPASVLIEHLASVSGWTCSSHVGDAVISVSFDGDTIKSAAEKIGEALGVSVWYDSGATTIHFGADNVDYMGDDYYDTFIVLGGTKNMSKRITNAQGVLEYVAVTHRLTLGSLGEEGSKITTGDFGFEKFLIFDDIYPKVRMRIRNVYRRQLWLHDDNGEKIQVGTSDGQPVYATYDKWYIILENAEGEGAIDQSTLNERIIDGTTLMLQFLPRSEGGTSPLAGRIFELVHFTGIEDIKEKEDDDVGDGFTVTTSMIEQGAYRIVISAEGSTLLPSTMERGLVPQVGDIVSFVNVAPPETCYQTARQRLYDAAIQSIGAYGGTPNSSTYYGNDAIGACIGGSIVTNVHTDLITGKRQVTRGTISQKGIISSLISKIEGAQTIGGGGTSKEEQPTSTLISEDQWEALRKAGGNLGMKSVVKGMADFANELESLGADMSSIASQADQKMDIHFGQYTPMPNNATVANITMPRNAQGRQDCKPAYDWMTEAEKVLHEEDLFYNYDGMASNPEGGTVWRWTKLARGRHYAEDGSVFTISSDIWVWAKVKDADTIAALEKIADVASDGKSTGGTEKVRLFSDWTRIVQEYAKYNGLAESYNIDVQSYNKAFSWLARMLNDGEVYSSGTPSWLTNLSLTQEILYTPSLIASLNEAYDGWDISASDITQASRLAYRKVWEEYNRQSEALDALCKAIANQAKETAENLADDGIISAGSEKSQLFTLWGETVAEFWKYLEQAEDYNLQNESAGNSLNSYYAYVSAFCALAWMLNDDTAGDYMDYTDQDGKFAYYVPDIMTGGHYPKWLSDGEGGTLDENTEIDADTYRSNWQDYYIAKAALLKDIEAAAKAATGSALETANAAMTLIYNIADDGKIVDTEISDVRETFLTALHETYDEGGIMDKANDANDNWIIDQTILTGISTQLTSIGRILNGEDKTSGTWVPPITKATGHATNLYLFDNSKWSGDGIPAYLQDNYDQFPIILGAQKSDYIYAWNEYYRLRTLALTALANKAQITANTANTKADNLASDSIISGGSEKNRLLIEWMAVVAEHSRYVTMAGYYSSVSANDYNTAYHNVALMLNNNISTNIDSVKSGSTTPSWLNSTNINTDTSITVSSYRNTWNEYYVARAALLQAIETASKALADKAQTDAAAAMQSYEDIASDGSIDASSELPKLRSMFNTVLSEMFGTGGYMIQAQDAAHSQQGSMVPTWIIDDSLVQAFNSAIKDLGNLLDNGQSPTWGTVYDGNWALDSNTGKFVRNLSTLRSPYYLDGSYSGGDVSITTNLSTTVDTFKAKWKAIYDARSAIVAALADYARHLAEQSMIIAEAAIARLDDIADDNTITKEELADVKKEFKLALYETYNSLYDKGRRGNNWISSAIQGWFNNRLVYAIVQIGRYLDGTTDNERLNSTWGDNPPSNPNNASFGWPAVVDDSFTMSQSIDIDREDFIDLWSEWYNARSAYLGLIANESLGRIEDMADDAKITPDEKKELRKQWRAWATEYNDFLSLFSADPLINGLSEVSAYKTAFANITAFLISPTNGSFPQDWATKTVDYWLGTMMISTSDTTDLTSAQVTLYKNYLTAFLTARTALLTALSTQKVSYYVSATKPEPPFYVGDRWLWLNHLPNGEIADGETENASGVVNPQTNSMMYCIRDNLATTNYNVSDYWVEASAILEKDPRSVLASLGDLLFREFEDYFPLVVQINGSSFAIGNITNYSPLTATEDMLLLLDELKEIVGDVTFHVYSDDDDPQSLVKYDLLCSKVTAPIPGSYDPATEGPQTVKGGVKIKMWNGTAWMYILESTNSLLDNLGTSILAMVFGSNASATEAAGLTVGQRFAKLFASATVWDPNHDNGDDTYGAFVNLAEAIFGLSVEPVTDDGGNILYYDEEGTPLEGVDDGHGNITYYDENNNLIADPIAEGYYPKYISSGKLSADKIDFEASQSLSALIGTTAKGIGMIARQEPTGSGADYSYSMGYYYTDNEDVEHYQPVLFFDSNGCLKINANTATIAAGMINVDVSELNINASDIYFGETWFTSNIDGRITTALNSFKVTANNITLAAVKDLSDAYGMLMKGSDGLSFGYYTKNPSTNQYVWHSGINFVVEDGVSKLNLTASNAKIASELIDFSGVQVSITSVVDGSTSVFEGGKLKLDYIDVDTLKAQIIDAEQIITDALSAGTIIAVGGKIQDLELVNLTVTGDSTFHGEVSGRILSNVDMRHNVCIVKTAGNHIVGDADIVMIGGRFNGASSDVIITLPDPTNYPDKVITIYGTQRPADFDTSGFTIRLAIDGTGQSEIKTAWGTTGILINNTVNNLKWTNEMVLRSDGSGWRLYKWTEIETTNTGTYVKDNMSGLW